MRTIVGAAFFLMAAFAVAQQPSKPREPINIMFGNEASEKPKLVAQANDLKKRRDPDSDDYTARYATMMKQLNIVGVSNLSATEIDLVSSIEKPTEAAVQRYMDAKARAVQASTSKTLEIKHWADSAKAEKKQEEIAAALAEKERAEKEEAIQREQERNRIEEKKANAMVRQARALESYSARYLW